MKERVTLSASEAARAAGITYRQLDYYGRLGILHQLAEMAGVDWLGRRQMDGAGSGSRREIPVEIIPMLRLMGRLQRAFGHTISTDVLRSIVERYGRGSMIFDGFALSWKVESE